MGGRLLVIALGVNTYLDPSLRDLHFAISDISHLTRALSPWLHDDDLLLHLQPGANAVEVMGKIRAFLRKHAPKSDDRVLCCFAGHGVVAPGRAGDEQYLLLAGAQVPALLEGHVAGNDALSVSALLAEFDVHAAAQFTLLIDACRMPPQERPPNPTNRTLSAVWAGVRGRDTALRFRKDGKAESVSPPAPKEDQAPAGRIDDPTAHHLVAYSCPEGGRAHETQKAEGGLFLKAMRNWIRMHSQTRTPAILDKSWLSWMASTMGEDAREAGIELEQRPWANQHEPWFVLGNPRLAGGTGVNTPIRHLPDSWCPKFVPVRPTPPLRLSPMAVTFDPVTWGQWLALMKAHPKHFPLHVHMGDEVPVTHVTRAACEKYAAALTSSFRKTFGETFPPFRLMTRSEWQTVCRCGDQQGSPNASTKAGAWSADRAVFRWSDCGYPRHRNPSQPAKVDHSSNYVNAWGLRGMYGNVRELVVDDRSPGKILAMGGSWKSQPDELWENNAMQLGPADSWLDDMGFRLTRALTPDELD